MYDEYDTNSFPKFTVYPIKIYPKMIEHTTQ